MSIHNICFCGEIREIFIWMQLLSEGLEFLERQTGTKQQEIFHNPDMAHLFNQKILIFFLFLDENICCGYSLELPYSGASGTEALLMSTYNMFFLWRNGEKCQRNG